MGVQQCPAPAPLPTPADVAALAYLRSAIARVSERFLPGDCSLDSEKKKVKETDHDDFAHTAVLGHPLRARHV